MSKEKATQDERLYRELLRLRAVKEMDLGDIAKELGINPRYITDLLFDAIRWLMEENRRLSSHAEPKVLKSDIEQRLLKRFPHLKEVCVVPGVEITEPHEYDALVTQWGSMAAAYLDRRADEAAAAGKEWRICMSGGETILELVDHLSPRERRNVFFFASALIGRPHMASSSHVDAVANTTIAWWRSGHIDGRCIYATVTPYDLSDAGSSYEAKKNMVGEQIDALSREPSIGVYLKQDLVEMDMAIAGLGMVVPPGSQEPKFLRRVRLTASNLLFNVAKIKQEDLREDGAIGEIGYCYFDVNGRDDDGKWRFYLTAGDHDERLRGVGFYRDMVRKKRDVVVSAGTFKEPAISAALKGQLFNVWFTNEHAARKILSEVDSA